MQVNATTFVQICNFWVTYLFLQKIFFKPVITMLLQKEALKKALRDDLKYKETALQQLQEKKNHQIADFKKLMGQSYPVTSHSIPEIPHGVFYQPTEEECSFFQSASTQFLIKKVPHAF